MSSWFIYVGILFYMEAVFHLRFFGLQFGNPLFPLGLLLLVASVQTLIGGCFGPRGGKIAFRIMVWIQYAVFAAQTVYYGIFRQPLRMAAAMMEGQDALTSYWREALQGLLAAVPILLLLAAPIILVEVLRKKGKWEFGAFTGMQKLRMGLVSWVCLVYCCCCMAIGGMVEAAYSEEYQEYYDPETVMCNMGVITMVQRDGAYEIGNLMTGLFQGSGTIPAAGASRDDSVMDPSRVSASGREVGGDGNGAGGSQGRATDGADGQEANGADDENADGRGANGAGDGDPAASGADGIGGGNSEGASSDGSGGSEGAEAGGGDQSPDAALAEEPDTSPHAWELDLAKLAELSGSSKEKKWLADYIAGLATTNRNEYTGLFEGYNLIYLTAEGFCTYAIREDLTPTLYKMVNSSFVFENYYVPLWQTSTSDGEYVNCTGLIPDGQHSMRKSADINMAYTLPRFFSTEGVYSRAYHDNTLSYYDRHLSHPNLGYDFKAARLGKLSREEWGDQIFPMENPKAWPASDYEMMQGTIPEYIDDERFHVYYMTVSGHMNYNFAGNQMSARNKDAVAGLDMSENARAYIACHIELDKALAYLLEQLEQAGKLENTVICLSADHYPYGMTEEQYEELAGKDLSADLDLYRNSLILWSASMEEPVIVEKACCSVDILPTLLNLFNFDYDSRMYAGRDIFSDEEGLVIFKDKSFVSDTVAYDKKKKTTTWLKELSAEEQDAYMDRMKQEVKDRYQFSAYILRNDYYSLIEQCRPSAGEGEQSP
ncbi:MAG: LTA synthase family protein [Roseburia sp.]|nr:LTA synthase family protein [Roseburia sp.]MCM1096712.1 LTA synthase family protein [Ruminococcus flavefaciens]